MHARLDPGRADAGMLELAAQLRGLPRTQLASALQSRDLDGTSVRDLFDLAEVLLAPDSVDHALSRLDRRHLAVLAAASSVADEHGDTTVAATRAELVQLGASSELSDAAAALVDELAAVLLVVRSDEHLHVPTAVSARIVVHTPRDIPPASELAAPAPPVLVGVDDVDRSLLERRAAEIAYATVAATAELLAALGTQPARELAKGGLAPWQTRRAAEMLSDRLDSSLDLKGLASECGLSVSHFSRAFRSSMGMAPHQWRIKQRLEMAKTMMRNNRGALAEIAVACGFTDQSHFTRIFTRATGTSPGQWRRCASD